MHLCTCFSVRDWLCDLLIDCANYVCDVPNGFNIDFWQLYSNGFFVFDFVVVFHQFLCYGSSKLFWYCNCVCWLFLSSCQIFQIMYACMGCMYICMHACMYVCMFVCMYASVYICVLCLYVVCVCRCVCLYVLMYIWMCDACACVGRGRVCHCFASQRGVVLRVYFRLRK